MPTTHSMSDSSVLDLPIKNELNFDSSRLKISSVMAKNSSKDSMESVSQEDLGREEQKG